MSESTRSLFPDIDDLFPLEEEGTKPDRKYQMQPGGESSIRSFDREARQDGREETKRAIRAMPDIYGSEPEIPEDGINLSHDE